MERIFRNIMSRTNLLLILFLAAMAVAVGIVLLDKYSRDAIPEREAPARTTSVRAGSEYASLENVDERFDHHGIELRA